MPTGGFITLSLNYEGRDGVETMARQFATWGAQISDLSEPLTAIGEDLLGDFAVNVVTEGGWFAPGGAWAPLAPSTVSERERLGFGGPSPILVRTGQLAASLASRDAAGNVFEVTATSLLVGSEDRTAGYHQRGTRRMPRRPIVGITFRRRSEIVRRIGDWVREVAAREGISVA